MDSDAHDAARRLLLRQSLALAGAAAIGTPGRAFAAGSSDVAAPASDPHPALGRNLQRIAFGCCADATKPQPVWDPILARRNDLFIFLGNNIYADTRDMSVLAAKYAELAAIPGFARLRDTTPAASTR